MRPSHIFSIFLLGGIVFSFILGAVALAALLTIFLIGVLALALVGSFFRAQRDAASASIALLKSNKDKPAKTNQSA